MSRVKKPLERRVGVSHSRCTGPRVRTPKMPLTRDFKETVQARVRSDPEFRRALLKESVESLLEGDLDTGKSLLRDYINATDGIRGRLGG